MANISPSCEECNLKHYLLEVLNLRYPNDITIGSLVSIDSFTFYIPLDKVEIIDEDLIDKYAYFNTRTGEVKEETTKKIEKYICSGSGIKTGFSIKSFPQGKERIQTDVLVVKVTSKLLRSNYLKGISKETIKDIYHKIMKMNVVTIAYDIFIKDTVCYDIDFKLDAEVRFFDGLIPLIQLMTKPSAFIGQGVQSFKKRDKNGLWENLGIQFNSRETSSPKKRPFLKMYHKKVELVNRSTSFYNSYLNDKKISNDMIRIEYTLKNQQHLKAHEIDNRSIGSIISIEENKKTKIMLHAFTQSIDPSLKKNIASDLKPADIVLLNLMHNLIEETDLSLKQILALAVRGIKGKSNRSKKKAKLRDIYIGYSHRFFPKNDTDYLDNWE